MKSRQHCVGPVDTWVFFGKSCAQCIQSREKDLWYVEQDLNFTEVAGARYFVEIVDDLDDVFVVHQHDRYRDGRDIGDKLVDR